MSTYQRNNSMVVCIIAVVAIGAILVAGFAYMGDWSWNWNTEQVRFSYDEDVGSVTGDVILDVDLGVGSVAVMFEDNATLLYRIDFAMDNRSYQQYGEPTVGFSSGTITLAHEVGSANITLGTGVNYTISIVTGTGSVSILLVLGHVGDVAVSAGTGSVSFIVMNDVQLVGSPSVSLETSTGSVTAMVDLPTGVGGSFEASTSVGSVSITAPSWEEITSSHYETSDYDTALHTLTIIAQAGTGSVTATLT